MKLKLSINLLKNKIAYKFNQVINPYPYRNYTIKHKCIFIHIPKTAGTSILTALSKNRINRDHASYEIFLRADPKKFHEYYKFSFVRNPWDRIVSTYEYLIQGGNKNEDIYFQILFKSKYDTFNKFVLDYLDKDSIHEHGMFKPQYLYIYNHKMECQVDYIGKFENLDRSFMEISKSLNLPYELPKINQSKRREYKDYFRNEDVKNKINQLYKKDIEYFKYSF